MIPLFRMEEHHEAFLVWHYAIARQLMPASYNALLHIDEHSDWAAPRLRRSVESAGSTLSGIAAFTYEELDIGSFIWPAIYKGIFSEVYWMRHQHTMQLTQRRLSIRAVNEDRTEFQTGLACGSGLDERVVVHELLTPYSPLSSASPVVLDIDLDYFSSHSYPDYTGRRLEISREAYEEFTGNPYHFLRIAPGSKITAAREAGKYYFYFNCAPGETGPRPPLISREEVAARMEALLQFLKASATVPLFIMICRSRYSGYTPRDQWQFIEDRLLSMLGELYSLEIHEIADVLEGAMADRKGEVAYVL